MCAAALGISGSTSEALADGREIIRGTSDSSATLFSFEDGSTEGWDATNVVGGPWSTSEWSVDGGASLKVDLALLPRATHTVSYTRDVSLAGATRISARVRTSPWGYFGDHPTARLYVKTGESWRWTSGEAVTLSAAQEGVELVLALSAVDGLEHVREVGIELREGSYASGLGALYVDRVAVDRGVVAAACPGAVDGTPISVPLRFDAPLSTFAADFRMRSGNPNHPDVYAIALNDSALTIVPSSTGHVGLRGYASRVYGTVRTWIELDLETGVLATRTVSYPPVSDVVLPHPLDGGDRRAYSSALRNLRELVAFVQQGNYHPEYGFTDSARSELLGALCYLDAMMDAL